MSVDFWTQIGAQLILDRGAADRATACTRRGCAAHLIEWERGDILTHPRLLRYNGPSRDRICSAVKGGCGCEHAELRLIVDCLKTFSPLERSVNWVLLTTLSPCTACAHLIVRSGLTRQVYYHELLQHDQAGVEVLRNDGIDVRIASGRGQP